MLSAERGARGASTAEQCSHDTLRDYGDVRLPVGTGTGYLHVPGKFMLASQSPSLKARDPRASSWWRAVAVVMNRAHLAAKVAWHDPLSRTGC